MSRPLLVIFLVFLPPSLRASAAEIDYTRDVKPILSARCYSCHGAIKQKSMFRLDTAAWAIKGGKHGGDIVPSKSSDSRLIQALTGAPGVEQMPAEGARLTSAQIRTLKDWIDQGAKSPADETAQQDPKDHWSFKPPIRPAVPQVKNAAWVRNPIDAFIADQHEKHGLVPRPEADRATLLRRVYLDLIGLPPSREKLHAFLADDSKGAYEKVVDELLASPQYGERWGRHWMDVWRYSDWAGFGNEVRDSQPFIWRWRDWIVESLNADKPYDRMLQEMLAADELEPADPQALRATGFLVRNWFKFNRNVWLDNTVEHTGKAFLGITLNCAKCHDHMYDPISQRESYQFRAFFEPLDVRTDRVPGVPDVLKDGTPRVYDANAAAKTFLFVRGNEKQPVETDPLPPAVPAVLGGSLNVQTVSLPPSAYYAGLQPFVQQESIASANAAIEPAQAALASASAVATNARKQLDQVIDQQSAKRDLNVAHDGAKDPAKPSPAGAAFLDDSFAKARLDTWKIGRGQWQYRAGRLLQRDVGETFHPLTSLKDHPQNFSASFRFKITGGQQWKSVGMSFDGTDAGDENGVYLSAHAEGPGSSLFVKTAGVVTYPPGNPLPLPIKTDQEYTLRIDVRDQLMNVYVDSTYIRAFRWPRPRLAGKFSVWAFDASAEFISVRVAELPADVKLIEDSPAAPAQLSGVAMPADPLGAARAIADRTREAELMAELHLQTVRTEAVFVSARVSADNAKYAPSPPADAPQLATTAGRRERELNVARAEEATQKAEHDLIAARLAMDVAKPDTLKAIAMAQEMVSNNRTKLYESRAALAKPSASYSTSTPIYPATSTGRRLALAKWITARENPLAARVAINHIWMRHVGEPIVPTVFEFGLNGKPLTNPRLLDWLAVELMEPTVTKGAAPWSMKSIHRLIVTSSTYRMRSDSAGADDPNRKLDPDNRFSWRANVKRMEAEVVRDSVLQLGGSLDMTMGGPDLDPEAGLTHPRRSIYFRQAHEKQMTFLTLFDAPSPTECYRRDQTVIPQQALALANSPLALETARKLAAKITQRVGDKPDAPTVNEFISQAFEEILSRPPTAPERASCEEFIARQTATLADPAKLLPFNAGIDAKVPPATVPHLRARESLVHVLLNHNDFVTIR